MPPAGQSVRMFSIATQATANQTGEAGSRRSGSATTARTAYHAAWTAESPSHGTVPTACIHHSNVNWKAAPNTRPGSHADLAGSPAGVTKKVATANGISQYAWVGGKQSASASPATRAARQRVGMGRKYRPGLNGS